MSGQDRRSVEGPTIRGMVCVLVYAVAFVVVTLVGFASLPRGVERPVQRGILRPAAWAGERVDWAAHGWVDRVRRRLGTSRRFRRFSAMVLDDALTETREAAGYVGTVSPPDGVDPTAWVERRLADVGFRRNPTAYLEYRDRDGPEFEHSSWALRSSVTADFQLHVRVFESDDGTVDVYGHREHSVTAGAAHYEPPDYRTGVAMTLEALEKAGVAIDRRSEIGGVTPDPVPTEGVPRPPLDLGRGEDR